MVIFVPTSAKIEGDVRIFTFSHHGSVLSRENAWRIFSIMVIFVPTSAKIEGDVRIFTFSLCNLGSENVFVLHQKMRKTSQKMSESTIGSNENEKKRDIIFGACHHNIKKISQLVSEFDSVFNLLLTSQRCSTFDQRLC